MVSPLRNANEAEVQSETYGLAPFIASERRRQRNSIFRQISNFVSCREEEKSIEVQNFEKNLFAKPSFRQPRDQEIILRGKFGKHEYRIPLEDEEIPRIWKLDHAQELLTNMH